MVLTHMQPTPRLALEEIFHAALERATASERQAYLDGACGKDGDLRQRAEALLSAHEEATGFLEVPLIDPGARQTIGEGPGSRIGPYKLLQQIGEGGMGVVYMAEQERPVRRKVALKIIKLGMDTKHVIARFEAERQALALMEHPNIARVLDAGATESGRPFFVMELVRGVAISEYCDKHQLATAERLQLFMDTCRAVQHAHHKGIIHRDIKPSNVLVTSHDGTPVVKIIDFGVAKATHQKLTEKTLFTEFGQFIGTPEYMSPEQAEMSGLDVDTRTDIYSLGVLLYQLLTGSTPFDAKTLRSAEYGEMTRMIREDEPHAPSTRISKLGAQITDFARQQGSDPSTLVKLCRGDLDWIVMRAIAKDRTRRYDSASGLADDVARHIRREPVLAGPPSTLYRARKLFERNRALSMATLLATLSILAGLGMALSGYFAARAEAERSQKISSALTGMLGVAGNAGVLDVDVEAMLATAREVFGEDHVTVAATLSAMAAQRLNAGDPGGSERIYLEALKSYRAEYGDEHSNVGQTYARLGSVQALNGASEDAEWSLREALRIEALVGGDATQAGCDARTELAKMLGARGEYAEAEELLRATLEILRTRATDRRFEIFVTLETLVQMSLSNPDRRDREPLYSELVVAATNAFPAGTLIPAMAEHSRAIYLARASRNAEAEVALRASVAKFSALESAPPVYLVMALDALFQIIRNNPGVEGRNEADRVLLNFLEVAPRVWGPDEVVLGENYGGATRRFYSHGRLSDALMAGEKYMDYLRRNHPNDRWPRNAPSISELIWAVAKQDEPGPDDLERALMMLDEFPHVAEIDQRVEATRAVLLFRLGHGEDVDDVLRAVRESASPVDRATFILLGEAESLIERLR